MLLEKRMTEFVHYHINGDGECNGIVLKEYADMHGLTDEKRITIHFCIFAFSIVRLCE